ncbi:MAG: ribosome maturation factor RimM [Spirochaetia bacterium]|jgi:16S rRNA processing protein RimM|nr:ribosome maturation factor RimM [Spirochaetales bacterium]MDX9783279.1 ribosome maturation factor RimM [Spirochaetia bacterium]
MNDRPENELLAVAKLGAPRGLKGLIKLHSYSGDYSHIKSLKQVLAAPDGEPDKGRILRVSLVESGERGLEMAFSGYESPEKARELTGLLLYLPREAASPLAENEYYIHDLVGMRVDCGALDAGLVEAVLEGGADPLLEVRKTGTGTTVLIPFRSEFVGEVDLKAKRLELLAGWLLE